MFYIYSVTKHAIIKANCEYVIARWTPEYKYHLQLTFLTPLFLGGFSAEVAKSAR
jgi:hypothetical protein